MNFLSPRFLPMALAALIAVGGAADSQAIGVWHRDYASAQAEARTEGKDILIVFTGTDWIELCAKFYDEILGEPEFIEAVSGKFALLKLEYPKDSNLPRTEYAEKAVLRDAYRVRGFPTVVLTDIAGRPFGLNGYQPATPGAYAEQILEIEKAHQESLEAIKGAERLEGVERAKQISEAIPDLPETLMARFYRKEMEAVLAADSGDALKLRKPFRKLLAEDEFAKQLQVLAKESKWTEMIALTNDHIFQQELEGTEKQIAMINRSGLEMRAGLKGSAEETLRAVVKIDPDSQPGKTAARLLESPNLSDETTLEKKELKPEKKPGEGSSLRAQPVP
ncbi:MAG TPA: thioredoxin family protein [Bacteroidia bacterium]|nr:thioredoxin family protein [Bacteroidia bacterium]